jgi:hypothetical protein
MNNGRTYVCLCCAYCKGSLYWNSWDCTSLHAMMIGHIKLGVNRKNWRHWSSIKREKARLFLNVVYNFLGNIIIAFLLYELRQPFDY